MEEKIEKSRQAGRLEGEQKKAEESARNLLSLGTLTEMVLESVYPAEFLARIK